ncbi:hypothetical protein L1887_57765 [Cichorium endivia]|nr:hypothetical protein L1887_57765 [Cichorium endivia]
MADEATSEHNLVWLVQSGLDRQGVQLWGRRPLQVDGKSSELHDGSRTVLEPVRVTESHEARTGARIKQPPRRSMGWRRAGLAWAEPMQSSKVAKWDIEWRAL